MTDTLNNNYKGEDERQLSVIITLTERCDEFESVYRRYHDIIETLNVSYEMIFVVDGDFPEEFQFLMDLKRSKGEDFSIIKLARSFGEATAISEGFKASRGKLIMTLPSYYQVDPDSIPGMYREIKGCDLVSVRRWPRMDSSLNQLQTKMFHCLIRRITGVEVNDIGCSVRLFKKEVLEEIPLYGDLHRFLPILADKQGFKIKEIELPQSKREKQVRMYAPGVYLKRIFDLLTVFFLVKFTKKPLRFFGISGTFVSIPGILILIYLLIGRFFMGMSLSDRPLFLISILLVVLGIQIIAIGLVGEIIIFTHARKIQEYTIEKIIN